MDGGSAAVTLTPTVEQDAARRSLGFSWVIDGMTPNGWLVLLSHNGVYYVGRYILPDGSMTEPHQL